MATSRRDSIWKSGSENQLIASRSFLAFTQMLFLLRETGETGTCLGETGTCLAATVLSLMLPSFLLKMEGNEGVRTFLTLSDDDCSSFTSPGSERASSAGNRISDNEVRSSPRAPASSQLGTCNRDNDFRQPSS
mmetsp:Transcript_24547/g.56241  ORF Transcript_24547/g.56241 Transcript_24547/m.56241 type:complete len:134 (+) Transcript_24547:1565-1966(+)